MDIAEASPKPSTTRFEMSEPPTESKSATALYNALQNHNANAVELKKVEGVVEIDCNTKPIDAAQILWELNIIGVPVWDAEKNKYCGFFDMRDILSAVIETTRRLEEHGAYDKYNEVMVQSLSEMKHDQEESLPYTLSYLVTRNIVHTFKPTTPLVKLCEALSQAKCSRVLICVKEGTHCVNMISRSSLVSFLSEHVSPDELMETMDQAGLEFRKPVVSVRDSVSAFEAFELIDSKGLYGIAVVDEEGALLGNTSARDIKHAALDKGRAAMDIDILSYLSGVRREASSKTTRYPTCHVREDSTVGHVLNLLAKTGYHRVFVVDQYLRPIGVVSDSDILGFVIEKSKKK